MYGLASAIACVVEEKMCMIKLLVAEMSYWLTLAWTCAKPVPCHYFVVCINFFRDFNCSYSFWFLCSGLCLWYWTVSIVQMAQLVLQHRAGWSVLSHLMMLHGFLNQSCCCCFIQRHNARPSTTSNRKIQQVTLFLGWNCKCWHSITYSWTPTEGGLWTVMASYYWIIIITGLSSVGSSSSEYLWGCLKQSSWVSHASSRPNDTFCYSGCSYTVGLDCFLLCSGILSHTSRCHSQMIHTACAFTVHRIPSQAKLSLQPNGIQEQFGDCVSPGTVPVGRMDRQTLLCPVSP